MSRSYVRGGRKSWGPISLAQLAVAALAVLTASMAALPAYANLVHFSGTDGDGRPVTATADFVYDTVSVQQTVTVTLTNTTANTVSAAELFTGIDFSLGGLTPTLDSAMGTHRTVNKSDGSYSDTGVEAIDWSFDVASAPILKLIWNPPNVQDGIIGPANQPEDRYINANNSILNSSPHQPFVGEVATFVLNVAGLTDDTPLEISAWRFGTTGMAAVPEPGAILFGVAVCGVVGLVTAGRRLKSRLIAHR